MSSERSLPTILFHYLIVLFVSAFMAVILSLILVVGNSTASPMSSDWVRIVILLFTVSATISAATSHRIGEFAGWLRVEVIPIVFLAAWLSLLAAVAVDVSNQIGTSLGPIFVFVLVAALISVALKLR
jgi:hypothetical protein